MPETEYQRRYREYAHTLAKIGAELEEIELPMVTVRLPINLAREAVAAWEWKDVGELDPETSEQRVDRHRTGCLANIGHAVKHTGRIDGDHIVVDLRAGEISGALDAAYDLPT
jgi:hypothetical protein